MTDETPKVEEVPPKVEVEDLGQGPIDKPDYPGHVSYVGDRGYIPGCKMMVCTVSELNEMFERSANTTDPLLLVDWKPLVREDDLLIMALISGVATDEKRRLAELHSDDCEAFLRQRKRERDEAKAKLEEAHAQAVDDNLALIELGRKCREHHGNLVNDARAQRKAAKLAEKAKRKGKK